MFSRLPSASALVMSLGLLALSALGSPARAEPKDRDDAAQASDRRAARAKKRRARRRRARARARSRRAAARAEQQRADKPSEAVPPAPTSDDAQTEPEAPAHDAPSAARLQRSSNMEFDPRLIRGQAAGAGAVMLIDRGQRRLPSLTKTRRRFLDATIDAVLGPDARRGSGE